MKTRRQKTGKLGEDAAVKYLRKNGHKILERNFRAGRYGEIDIIANDKGQLVFVEVKTKTNEQFGPPEQEFTYQKKKKMRRAIQNYLFKNYSQDRSWRVDLIAIEIFNPVKSREEKISPKAKLFNRVNKKINLRHYKDISL